MEEIKLTPQEFEEVKDDVRYKTNMTLSVKVIKEELKKLNSIPIKVSRLETKVSLLMWLIPIVLLVIGFVFYR